MKYLLLAITLTGCTDASFKHLTTLGSPGAIKCYSGGELIYDGMSTGKIETVTNSDGWEFVDTKTGKFLRVSGDCVIEN